MRRLAAALLVLGGAATLSCGDVPTGENGIAFYTPVLLPLPAVAAGDTLRDSLGRAAPLRVLAFSRDSQEITGLTVTFVPVLIPADVTIDSATGILVARDTLRSVQLVGRIGDRLQTSVVTLQIVPEPSVITRTEDATADTAISVLTPKPLPVAITGTFRGVTTPVNGIIVHYTIDSLLPRGLPSGSAILTTPTGTSLRPDSTTAVDTTKTAGNSTRSVLVLAGSPVARVFVSIRANHLHDGTPLTGSPVRFDIAVKPQTPP
jgi:hypothetical protein